MNSAERFEYWVSMAVALALILVGANYYPGVEKIFFERGGILIFIIVAIWIPFRTPSSNEKGKKPVFFWDDDNDEKR